MGLSVLLPCKLVLLSEKVGFFCCFFQHKDITFGLVFLKIYLFTNLKFTSGIWSKFLTLMHLENIVQLITLCLIRAWKEEHIYLHLLWPSIDMPMHN